MKRRSWTFWFGFGLLLASGAVWLARHPAGSAPASLPGVPATAESNRMLRERLQAAQAAIRDLNRDSAAVRRLARLYHANHYYTEAQACYDLLARAASGLTPQDRYLLADLALNAGDLAAAEVQLRAVIAAGQTYVPARVALGRALLKSGQADAAAREFAAILEAEPKHIEATVSLARIDLQRGDEAAAVARLDSLVAARPEATSAVTLLAQLLDRLGKSDRAMALRKKSQQRPEPPEPDPWMAELDSEIYDVRLLGLRFEQSAHDPDPDRAQAFLRRMEEIEPGTPTVPMLQGAAAARGRRHQEAATHFQAALARGGDPEKVCPVLVEALLAAGQTQLALTLIAGYHAKHPDSVPLLLAYSSACVKQKDHPRAREILSRALEHQPHLVPQNMALAEILWAQGEFEAAAACVQRVAEVDAKHLSARALLGEYHLRRSDASAALAVLEEAWALSPSDPAARQQLETMLVTAHLLAAQHATAAGASDAALAHFDQAAELSPRESRAHAGRAQVLVRLGDFAGAAEALEKLAALQPENPTILLSLGDVRLQEGRKDLAMQQWTAARRLVASGDDDLRAAIDQRLGGRVSPRASP